MNALDTALPRGATKCPVCGGPNDCAAAHSGTFDTPCWCTQVTIDQAILERLPPDRRGVACLCRGCAGANDPNDANTTTARSER